jgi:hypothetical protein
MERRAGGSEPDQGPPAWTPAARRAARELEKVAERAAVELEKAREQAKRELEQERERTRRERQRAQGPPEPRPAPQATSDSQPAASAGATPPEELDRASPGSWTGSFFTVALAALAGASLLAATLVVRRRLGHVEPRGAPTIVEPLVAPASGNAAARSPFGHEPRYEILERIGAGGMGVVYRARDRRLGRDVALKRLSEQLIDHPKAVRYFLREARAIAALNHPNIVTLYDVDEQDGVPFLTMELLEGRNLAQIVSARGPFSSADTARLGAQAAAGLACAHRQGIVHRDVKSANLFLTRARVVKVMDFGLAKMAEELRRSGTVLGTPQYMAPEQAMGRGADHRVDLYALGVTLFQLVTASWPYQEGDPARHDPSAPPPDPRGRRPDVLGSLAELILACLAKEPEKRPGSADEVAARLRSIAGMAAAPPQ